jgi:hypothetical protein
MDVTNYFLFCSLYFTLVAGLGLSLASVWLSLLKKEVCSTYLYNSVQNLGIIAVEAVLRMIV